MSAAGTAQLFALAAALFTLVGFALASGLSVALRSRLASFEPESRADAWTAIAIVPIVTSLVGVAACVLPSISAHLLGGHDHCSHHGGHPHLCPWHLVETGTREGWLLLASIGALLLVAATRAVFDVARARRLTRSLVEGRCERTRVLDTAEPFSAAVGLLSPVVIVSRGLAEALTPVELDAAIAHERAHARRRDALRLWLVRTLWTLVPRAASRTLLAELALACEEACDRTSAEAVGDPLIVADAIVKASRAMQPLDLATAIGFGATTIERRVRALLDPPTTRATFPWLTLGAFALVTLLFADPLHHATETVLGFLAH